VGEERRQAKNRVPVHVVVHDQVTIWSQQLPECAQNSASVLRLEVQEKAETGNEAETLAAQETRFCCHVTVDELCIRHPSLGYGQLSGARIYSKLVPDQVLEYSNDPACATGIIKIGCIRIRRSVPAKEILQDDLLELKDGQFESVCY
jgi:hypothetical protein